MDNYEFELPYPPSVNGYWKPFRNRIILSKRGREYRVTSLNSLIGQGLQGESIQSNVIVSIILNPPSLRRYDVDNYCKSILDSLTHAEFWDDDSQVRKLTVSKGEKVKGGNVKIKVEVINELI